MEPLAVVLLFLALVAIMVVWVALFSWMRAGMVIQPQVMQATEGEDVYSQIGVAKLGRTWVPFQYATLVATPARIDVFIARTHHAFTKESIKELSQYQGVFRVGLRIEHADPGISTPLDFIPVNHRRLLAALQARGYSVGPDRVRRRTL